MNLGAKPRSPDARDLWLGAATLPDYPATFMQERAFTMPIYNQLHQPACSSHAAAWLKNFLGDLDTASPRYTWEDIKSFDGFPIMDGTNMRCLFQSLQHGVIPLSTVPNQTDMTPEMYASPVDLTPTNEAKAGQDVIDSYAFYDKPSFETLKQLIYQHKAVVLLIALGTEFWTAPNGRSSYAEKDICPLRTPSTIVSHHFVVAHSYTEDAIWCANSFGPHYAHQGHFYFGSDYMPYVLEAGTAIDHATAVAISDKLGLLSKSLIQSQNPNSAIVAKLAAIMKKLGL
jgi:hypothetical protein